MSENVSVSAHMFVVKEKDDLIEKRQEPHLIARTCL